MLSHFQPRLKEEDIYTEEFSEEPSLVCGKPMIYTKPMIYVRSLVYQIVCKVQRPRSVSINRSIDRSIVISILTAWAARSSMWAVRSIGCRFAHFFYRSLNGRQFRTRRAAAGSRTVGGRVPNALCYSTSIRDEID